MNLSLAKHLLYCFLACWALLWLAGPTIGQEATLTDSQMEIVRQYQSQRVSAIDRVSSSVIAIYDDDRQGGGSGVIISPSGIALTNHHVIMGAGVKGWGGLAGDQMFRWKLIGTDPGGDVSLIQMIPNDDDVTFPWSPLGDSDQVSVGDWALAMGNPFLLTEDQFPTVTLGIVSGVKRYQYGAGQNQLVYGNCIQVDSSINPGNSGGPLFNFDGEVIGINGRGSFQDRGRVNVGLGYAISSNQIKNFIPDLLATKLVEHGTLDCNFSDRNEKVVCSTLNQDSPVADAGLALGDELTEFEGVPISTANQFTNLVCTLPETWPAHLKVQSPTGEVKDITVRLLGLPYARPKMPKKKPPRQNKKGDGDEPSKEENQRRRQMEMLRLLSAKPGTVRDQAVNSGYCERLIDHLLAQSPEDLGGEAPKKFLLIEDSLSAVDDTGLERMRTTLCSDGRFAVEIFESPEAQEQPAEIFYFDGTEFVKWTPSETKTMTAIEAKLSLPILQAIAMQAMNRGNPLTGFGRQKKSLFGETQLDGSDKCNSRNAWRFRVEDSDKDPLFWWAAMDRQRSDQASTLCKVSATLDNLASDDMAGAVMLDDWQTIEDFRIALQRKFVSGIAEEVTVELTNQKTSLTDGQVFEKLATPDEPKEEPPATEPTDASEKAEATDE